MENLHPGAQAHDNDGRKGGIVLLKLHQTWLVMMLLFALAAVMRGQDATTEPANVAGKWTISIQGQRGSRTQNMAIQQDGTKISGSIQGDRGDQELQGAVEENNIQFTVSMNTPRGLVKLEYRGTVHGNSMKGTIQGPIGAGSWSAKREGD
jgi:hypothetical protein